MNLIERIDQIVDTAVQQALSMPPALLKRLLYFNMLIIPFGFILLYLNVSNAEFVTLVWAYMVLGSLKNIGVLVFKDDLFRLVAQVIFIYVLLAFNSATLPVLAVLWLVQYLVTTTSKRSASEQ